MAKKITNKLAHLPQDITIDRYEEHHDSMELFISYPPEERICPDCGSHDCVIHSSGHPETIRHLGICGNVVLLTFGSPLFPVDFISFPVVSTIHLDALL